MPRLPEDPEDYAARLRRFRRGVGPTRAALSAAGAAWHRIDIQTTREFRDVVAAACAVVVSLTSHDPTHGGPR